MKWKGKRTPERRAALFSNDRRLSTESFQLNPHFMMMYDENKSQITDDKGDCAVDSTPAAFIFLNFTTFSF